MHIIKRSERVDTVSCCSYTHTHTNTIKKNGMKENKEIMPAAIKQQQHQHTAAFVYCY